MRRAHLRRDRDRLLGSMLPVYSIAKSGTRYRWALWQSAADLPIAANREEGLVRACPPEARGAAKSFAAGESAAVSIAPGAQRVAGGFVLGISGVLRERASLLEDARTLLGSVVEDRDLVAMFGRAAAHRARLFDGDGREYRLPRGDLVWDLLQRGEPLPRPFLLRSREEMAAWKMPVMPVWRLVAPSGHFADAVIGVTLRFLCGVLREGLERPIPRDVQRAFDAASEVRRHELRDLTERIEKRVRQRRARQRSGRCVECGNVIAAERS